MPRRRCQRITDPEEVGKRRQEVEVETCEEGCKDEKKASLPRSKCATSQETEEDEESESDI